MKDFIKENEFRMSKYVEKRNVKWVAGIALTAVAAGITIYIVRKIRIRRKLKLVSNEGYETAYDIHFPLKHNRPGKGEKINTSS